MIYFVTGNPVPWNGRGAGSNLFTDSILAVDAHSGQYRWHFQSVHHDIWDYDLPNPPFSFEMEVNGVQRKAVAASGKTGWLYILDRVTGLPLYGSAAPGGIREKKVPQDRYSETWKTQPHVNGTPYVKQCSTRKDWRKPAPDGKLYKVGCIFTPYNPSRFYASRPSASGGTDWPPTSFSTETKYAYVCATESPGSGLGAIPKRLIDPQPGQILTVLGVNFGGGATGKTTGVFAAVDMRDHSIKWTKAWAAPCYSGSFNTAGGLVFVGQTAGPARVQHRDGRPALAVAEGHRRDHQRAGDDLQRERQAVRHRPCPRDQGQRRGLHVHPAVADDSRSGGRPRAAAAPSRFQAALISCKALGTAAGCQPPFTVEQSNPRSSHVHRSRLILAVVTALVAALAVASYAAARPSASTARVAVKVSAKEYRSPSRSRPSRSATSSPSR